MHIYTYYGVKPPPFLNSKEPSVYVWKGKFSLTSEVGTLSLCFSRAQLLPLALLLECLGENKTWILLLLTNTSCLAQGPSISYFKLSTYKGSVDVETATGVKTDSLEALVREADDMSGDVNWLRAEMV